MKTQETIISAVAYGGDGIAKPDGRVVFVPGALPGETVTIEIVSESRNFARARLLEILDPSPARIQPRCKYCAPAPQDADTASSVCPGCVYQHLVYTEEVRLKHAQLRELLQRIGRITEPALLPPVPSPAETYYRNKIVLHGETQNGRTSLGYVGIDNRHVVDIEHCSLAVMPINEILQSVRKDRNLLNSLAGNSAVTFRYTSADGAMWWRGIPDRSVQLTENTVIGNLHVPGNAFFQVNPAVADTVVSRVMDLVSSLKPDIAVDLYCGVGILSLACAKAGVPEVVGIEINPDAVAAASANAGALGLRNAFFRCDTAKRGLRGLLQKLAGRTNPVLLLDPPRRGLDTGLLELLPEIQNATVIYISCAPDTLARDLRFLTAHGFTILHTQVFDMFPRTPYFESITVLSGPSTGCPAEPE